MYQTRADPGPRRTASTICRAARCWAGPARSTPWSIRAARPAISTIGRRWAIPAGAGRTCCRSISGWRITRWAPVPITAPAARCTSATIDGAVHPLTRLYLKAGQEAGLAFNPDLNGETIEGVGLLPDQHPRWVSHVGRARLSLAGAQPAQPARSRPRRSRRGFCSRASARSASPMSSAVRLHEARAGREVILSGGSINSPQLLQLSGVGPADVLRACGIDVLHDSPAVGRNLQDHLCFDHVYRSTRPSLNNELYPWWGKLRAGLHYILTRKGPLSLSVNQGGGFFRARPDSARPDIQLYFSPLTYEKAPPGVRALMQARSVSRASSSAPRPAGRPAAAICRSAQPIRTRRRRSIRTIFRPTTMSRSCWPAPASCGGWPRRRRWRRSSPRS